MDVIFIMHVYKHYNKHVYIYNYIYADFDDVFKYGRMIKHDKTTHGSVICHHLICGWFIPHISGVNISIVYPLMLCMQLRITA
jgi:hypothetical protein